MGMSPGTHCWGYVTIHLELLPVHQCSAECHNLPHIDQQDFLNWSHRISPVTASMQCLETHPWSFHLCSEWQLPQRSMMTTQIAKDHGVHMRPTWVLWAPCKPHESCYQDTDLKLGCLDSSPVAYCHRLLSWGPSVWEIRWWDTSLTEVSVTWKSFVHWLRVCYARKQ